MKRLALVLALLPVGQAMADPEPTRAKREVSPPSVQTGKEAASSIRGMGELFENARPNRAALPRQRDVRFVVTSLFGQHFLDHNPPTTYSGNHSVTATPGRIVGKSVRTRSALVEDDVITSKVTLNPVTGEGRLKASSKAINKLDRTQHSSGGSLLRTARGDGTFDVLGNASEYEATLIRPPVQLGGSKPGIFERLRLTLALRGLPLEVKQTVLAGGAVDLFTRRTRSTSKPLRSLPKEVRPPSKTVRSVAHYAVVGGRAYQLDAKQVATLRAVRPR